MIAGRYCKARFPRRFVEVVLIFLRDLILASVIVGDVEVVAGRVEIMLESNSTRLETKEVGMLSTGLLCVLPLPESTTFTDILRALYR